MRTWTVLVWNWDAPFSHNIEGDLEGAIAWVHREWPGAAFKILDEQGAEQV